MFEQLKKEIQKSDYCKDLFPKENFEDLIYKNNITGSVRCKTNAA